jgi:uncharacterized protein
MNPHWLLDGAADAPVTVALAHGAGAGMDSEFMQVMACGLADAGLRVVRFEFPYMIARRQDGRRRPPDRQPILLQIWRDVVAELGAASRLVIRGKSLGGRVASLVADELGVAGLVCLGYPFHPAGRPARLRTEHLHEIRTPTLIVQGERDSFGSRAEVAGYSLAPSVRVEWLADGDHSFRPRRASGREEADNLAHAVELTAAFCAAAGRPGG